MYIIRNSHGRCIYSELICVGEPQHARRPSIYIMPYAIEPLVARRIPRCHAYVNEFKIGSTCAFNYIHNSIAIICVRAE